MKYYFLFPFLLLILQSKSIYIYIKETSQHCSKREILNPEKQISNQISYKFRLNRQDKHENDYSFNFIQLVINPNFENDNLFSKFKGNVMHKHVNNLSTIDYKDPEWFISNNWEVVYDELNKFENFYIIENHPTCKDSILIRKVDYHKIEFE